MMNFRKLKHLNKCIVGILDIPIVVVIRTSVTALVVIIVTTTTTTLLSVFSLLSVIQLVL